jgi:hypothetical protein
MRLMLILLVIKKGDHVGGAEYACNTNPVGPAPSDGTGKTLGPSVAIHKSGEGHSGAAAWH